MAVHRTGGRIEGGAGLSRLPAVLLARLAPGLFVLLWSTGFIGAKYGLPHAQPLSFLLVRYALVILLMGLLVLAMQAPWPKDLRKCAHIGVTGLLVHGVYLGGVFWAISRGLPAGITSLIVGLQPLLTAAFAGLMLGDKVRPRQWLGLLLGLIGMTLVLSSRVQAGFGIAGFPAALLALVGITLGTLYQKRFCPSFDFRSGAVLQFAPAAVATLLVAGVVEDFRIEWTPSFLFALSWLVLVLSIGAISLLNFLIRSGSAVNVASLFYLVPPCTAVIAWLAFGETLTPLALGGMAVAVWGVYLARK
ncbi:MAG: DMT family transporter [Rhodocyclaceae bacterium]|nr:DMT family transporter [Rhodocyclaceae bacterium]